MSEFSSNGSMRFASAKEKKQVRKMKLEAELERREEDESCGETDKRVLRKEQKKVARETKMHEAQNKKAAARELLKVEKVAINSDIAYSREWWNPPLPEQKEIKAIPIEKKKEVTKPMSLEKNDNRSRSTVEKQLNESNMFPSFPVSKNRRTIVHYSKSERFAYM